jgi:hypothetical protein
MLSNPHSPTLLRVRFSIATVLGLLLMPTALCPLLLVLQAPMMTVTLGRLGSRQKATPPQRLLDSSL